MPKGLIIDNNDHEPPVAEGDGYDNSDDDAEGDDDDYAEDTENRHWRRYLFSDPHMSTH